MVSISDHHSDVPTTVCVVVSKENIPIEPEDAFNYTTLYVDFNTEPFQNVLLHEQHLDNMICISVEQAVRLAKMILEEYGND